MVLPVFTHIVHYIIGGTLCRLKLTTGGSLNHLGAQGRQSSKTVHLPKSLILREMQQKAVDREDTICTILLPAWNHLEAMLRLLCTIWEPACAILGHLETI